MPASKDQFSERELQHMSIAFQCLKDPSALQINIEKFAEAAGFQSTGGARNAFGAIKKKLLGGIQTNTNSSPAATPKKVGTTGVSLTTPKQENDEVENQATTNDSEVADNEETPNAASSKKVTAKTVRKSKAKSAPVKSEQEEDDGINDAKPAANGEDNSADEVTPVKPKRKYTRKPKDPNTPPTKRAKKQVSTLAAKGNHEGVKGGPIPNGNGNDDEAGEEEDPNISLFNGSHKASVKAENNLGSDFDVQTASQEQLAAENILVPNAV